MDYRKIIKKRGLKQRWIAQQLQITDACLSMFFDSKTTISPEKVRKLNSILGIKKETEY